MKKQIHRVFISTATFLMVVFVFYTGLANGQTNVLKVTPRLFPTSQIKYNTQIDTSSTGKQLQPWQPKPKDEVIMSRGDIAKSNADLVAKITDPSKVHSLEELNAFTARTMKEDTNISYAKLSGTITEIDYIFPGRLLGFIPFHPITRIFVGSKQDVRVQSPWYRFVLGKTVDLSSKELEGSLKSNSATMAALANDYSRWAYQFKALTSIIKAKHDAVK